MTRLELVRELESFRAGQVRELYRVDGELVEVSTVPHTRDRLDLDGLLGVVATLIGPGDPHAEYGANRDPDLEETMAFAVVDEEGSRLDNWHIVAAQGEGSRARVLEMLVAGVSWRSDWPHCGTFGEKRRNIGP